MIANRLIGSLPSEEVREIAPHLERVELHQRQVLFEPNQYINHVYFPTTAVVSLVTAFKNGDAIEIGTVGREGVVGLPVFLSGDKSTVSAMVQLPGTAYRLPADVLRSVAAVNRPLHGLIMRYVQAFMTQVAQTAACNSAHLVEERCARWLLTMQDRVDGDEFPLTHEFLAFMLGVRRSGVTVAMRTLKEAGLVQYTRGKLRIINRDRLQLASCECYTAVRTNFERVLPA